MLFIVDFHSRPKISPCDEKPSIQDDSSNEINHLKDEKHLLKDIIDRAAASIVDLIQVSNMKSSWRKFFDVRIILLPITSLSSNVEC